MASWDLSEIQPGQPIKADHMRQAMSDAQGDIDLNGNELQNVSEITFTDPASTRTNLGLGDSATKDVGTGSGDVAAGNDSRFVTNGNSHDHSGGDGGTIAYSSLSGTPTLGDAAAKNTGTGSGDVAAGNHNHSGVYEPANANIQSHISDTANPHSVTKTQVGLGNVDNFATASQGEAEAGLGTNKFMTPQRVAQAIAALVTPPATDLDDLTDVTITTPTDGDVLTYDSGSWINAPATGGGASDIVDLGDVNIGSPSDGDVLTYDSGSSKWINAAPPSGALPTQTGHDGALLYTDGTDSHWLDGLTYDGTTLTTTVPAEYLKVSADGNPFTFTFKKRGQTGDASGAVKSGSSLGALIFQGWDGSWYYPIPSAYISANATEDYSTGHNGAHLDFANMINGAAFQALRLRISGETGNVLINTSSDDSTNKCQIGGKVRASANSGALPTALTGTVLHLANADSTVTRITLDSFGEAPAITGRRAGGTNSSKSAVSADDLLMGVTGYGYGSSDYSGGARAIVQLNAGENWSDTAQGSYIRFYTTANTTTTTAEKMRLSGAGNLLINSTSDDATNKLQVNGQIKGTKLGLGASPTLGLLHVTGASGESDLITANSDFTTPQAILQADRNTSSGGGAVVFKTSKGSAASPSTMASGDLLSSIITRAHDGTDYGTIASMIRTYADTTVSGNVVPGRISFWTAPGSGSDGIREAMRINSDGNLLVGTTAILQTSTGRTYLGVRGASAAGAIELSATQADADASIHGAISTSDVNTSATDKRLGAIVFQTDGSTANNRGGRITFYTKADNASGLSSHVYITQGGRLLVGTSTDDGSNKVQVNGTVKATTLIGDYNAETSGCTLTVPFVMSFVAAKVQNGTASAAFSTPASGAPTATAVVGTNTIYGTLSFADSGTQYVQDRISLPSDWTGNIDAEITWRSSATSGNVVWQIATAGVNDGSTGDPSFNTANTVTDATKGTANQFNTCTISSLTTTGLAAGGEFIFKILRDPSHASDTLGAAAELIMRLARALGPFRRFNLAHPKLLILR